MGKWWIGVALLAGLMAGVPARAQNPYLPNSGNPAVMPDPVPTYSMPPATMPPLPSPGGPAGPAAACDSPLSLPADTPTAWDEVEPAEPACYFGIGWLAMQRHRLERAPVAVLDNFSNGIDTGTVPPTFPRPTLVGDLHDIDPRLNQGLRLTLGYHWCDYAIEASGFYLAQSSNTRVYANPGRLDVPFNINGRTDIFPLGFEGDNGMWLQDDIVSTRLQTSLASGEVNFRYWIWKGSSFNWLVGVRYLNDYERFTYYVGDDDLTVRNLNGQPDPTRQASYITTTNNHLVAGQLGLDWSKPICCWLAFSLTAKGAWGENFVDFDTRLKRGDGFIGFDNHTSKTPFSHLYELGAFLNFRLMDNAQLRAGYNLLWVIDVAEAAEQYDYNLANRLGRQNDHGDIFYHGPSVELMLLF